MLINPDLTCEKCTLFWFNEQVTPPCCTSQGCPIGEDLATDSAVFNDCFTYLQTKYLAESTGMADVQRDTLEALGLDKDPSTLSRLESIWWKHRRKQADSARKR